MKNYRSSAIIVVSVDTSTRSAVMEFMMQQSLSGVILCWLMVLYSGKLGEVVMALRGDEVAQDLQEEEAGEESNITQTKVGVSTHNRMKLVGRMLGQVLSLLRASLERASQGR
jgi:hypothetical protein